MAITKFFEAAKNWLSMRKPVQAPPGVQAEFLLTYGELLIGTLSVKDDLWRFEYSAALKQSDLRPIVEFPDVDRVYENEELWQFFASRIPSPEQPEVEEILKRERIAEDDAVSLLKRFGRQTINNPFQLKAA